MMSNYRKSVLLSALFFVWVLLVYNCTPHTIQNGETAVKKYFYSQMDSLMTHLSALYSAVQNKQSIAQLKKHFVTCRLQYKKTEAITEYYFQGLTRRINGPALPDVKTEDSQVWPPHGFQVVEELLYDGYNDTVAASLSNEIRLLQTDLKFVQTTMQPISMQPQHIFEIIQHQLIRLATLGITGFDAPLSKLSLPETQAALQDLQQIFTQYYGLRQLTADAKKLFASSHQYLAKNNHFDAFDRMEFITQYLMPLSEILAHNTANSIKDTLLTKPFTGTLAHLMAGKGFNADAYTGYATAASSTTKVELGKQLFFDKQLSASGTISCATCHNPALYFTDNNPKADNFVHGGTLQRNTPTLYYAALQSHQFYDMRSITLEDQAHEVMRNKDEFGFGSNEIAKKLWADAQYKKWFQKAFNITSSITGYEVRNAIAAYVRSLSPFSSAFDNYMRGNMQALSNEAVNGFNLFMGKAKCGTCHFAPLFNGNAPPFYTKSESEIIGVPASVKWQHAHIDKDSGRYKINAIAELLYAFKTPSIRNIAKTAPYMHNGVYKSLNDVMTFYQKGGGVGIGIDLPDQTLPFDSLSLNKNEVNAIIAFMQSLTDAIDSK